MKRANFFVKTLFAACFFFSLLNSFAQGPLLSTPPGGNKKASVSEWIGITNVSIDYHRPGVKGREGKIYGTSVVHEGYVDKSVEYGTATEAPWRAGANENTTITFSTDVMVEGKKLAAGCYGFFVAFGPQTSTVIFSRDNQSWGNYFYDKNNDALRVNVSTHTTEKSVEWLKYEFTDQTDSSAVIALQWEKVVIPFTVSVDLITTQLESFREELKSDKGFDINSWLQASSFCLENNTHPEEGYSWAKSAVLYQKDFRTLSNLTAYEFQFGKTKAADSLLNELLPTGTLLQVHFYGKSLITQNHPQEALKVFLYNAEKHPKEFIPLAGLARGYAANNDLKKALSFAKKALPLAPDDMNKQAVQNMITTLESGKNIY